MAELKIRKVPDKSLRKKPSAIVTISDKDLNDLSNMAETMYLNQGVGLAATQVGINKQLAVVDVGDGLMRFVNPVIIKKDGVAIQEEGCLSVPDACIKVKRAKRISVKFLNEEGQPKQLTAEGLLARAIQHEVDHLSGVLILDYLNPVQRLFLRKRSKVKKI